MSPNFSQFFLSIASWKPELILLWLYSQIAQNLDDPIPSRVS